MKESRLYNLHGADQLSSCVSHVLFYYCLLFLFLALAGNIFLRGKTVDFFEKYEQNQINLDDPAV